MKFNNMYMKGFRTGPSPNVPLWPVGHFELKAPESLWAQVKLWFLP